MYLNTLLILLQTKYKNQSKSQSRLSVVKTQYDLDNRIAKK